VIARLRENTRAIHVCEREGGGGIETTTKKKKNEKKKKKKKKQQQQQQGFYYPTSPVLNGMHHMATHQSMTRLMQVPC
jgi:hypothetical protein